MIINIDDLQSSSLSLSVKLLNKAYLFIDKTITMRNLRVFHAATSVTISPEASRKSLQDAIENKLSDFCSFFKQTLSTQFPEMSLEVKVKVLEQVIDMVFTPENIYTKMIEHPTVATSRLKSIQELQQKIQELQQKTQEKNKTMSSPKISIDRKWAIHAAVLKSKKIIDRGGIATITPQIFKEVMNELLDQRLLPEVKKVMSALSHTEEFLILNSPATLPLFNQNMDENMDGKDHLQQIISTIFKAQKP